MYNQVRKLTLQHLAIPKALCTQHTLLSKSLASWHDALVWCRVVLLFCYRLVIINIYYELPLWWTKTRMTLRYFCQHYVILTIIIVTTSREMQPFSTIFCKVTKCMMRCVSYFVILLDKIWLLMREIEMRSNHFNYPTLIILVVVVVIVMSWRTRPSIILLIRW